MDSLSHGLTGQIVGSFWKPKTASKARWFWASFILTNLPDIDFLFMFGGKELYQFQHRGLTHSFLGLLIMIPLGLWIFRKIVGKNILSFKQQVFYISTQIIFGHLVLDYLTSYGVMFLYPFSLSRFATPLMFIIDWLFWSLLIFSCIVLWLVTKYRFHWLKHVTALNMMVIGCVWFTQNTVKMMVEEQFVNELQDQQFITKDMISDTKKLSVFSYPKWRSLWEWQLVAILKDTSRPDDIFIQNTKAFQGHAVAPIPSLQFQVRLIPPPKGYSVNTLCSSPNLNFSEQKKQKFLRYKKWATHLACVEKTIEHRRGCHCLVLKYNILGEDIRFGTYWIPETGEAEFL